MARRIVDLSVTIEHMGFSNEPSVHQQPAFWDVRTHETTRGLYVHAPDLSWHIRTMVLGEHITTHVDALSHYTPGPEALSMERIPLERFITSALCVDLSDVEPRSFITRQHLQRALDRARLAIAPGDTFLYYQAFYQRQHLPDWRRLWAGLDAEATHWLADQGVGNIGCETPSIDNPVAMALDANPAFPAHRACRDRGMLNTENLTNLEAVVGRRFTYIGLPLKLKGGTGCPIRAIAIVEE